MFYHVKAKKKSFKIQKKKKRSEKEGTRRFSCHDFPFWTNRQIKDARTIQTGNFLTEVFMLSEYIDKINQLFVSVNLRCSLEKVR